MSRLVCITLLAGSGCFYTDPINQRPSIAIVMDSAATVHRDDLVNLHALANDPDGDFVTYTWHTQACVDATDAGTCGPAFKTDIGDKTMFTVPRFLGNQMQVKSLRVVLEARDDRGATAKPSQVLVIPVEDYPPSLVLHEEGAHGSVINTPIDLFAKVGDRDDGARNVTLTWVVFSPATQPTYTLDPISVTSDPDPAFIQSGMRFTPNGVGKWDIQVTASDKTGPDDTYGKDTVQHLIITVNADHAPCISQVTPIVAPVGQVLTVYDPTLFEVLVVSDDLDSYPMIPNDPIAGAPTFRWSLLPPGASVRQPLTGVTGNNVAIDPATYTPGDIVELRVEIEDRNHTPITCVDANPTCSVISDPTCIQRLTWRMELR